VAKPRKTLRQTVTEAVEASPLSEEEDPRQEYLDEITKYEKEFKTWEGRVKRIIDRYRDESRRDKTMDARFNILWANVQTLVPATFSRLPQPDVSRRFRDNDPVGRVASLILERALEFEIQHYPDYKATMRQSVFDRFLGGRGTCWIRYEPHFKQAESKGMPEDGPQVTEDVEAEEPEEQLDYECVPVDYVHWKDFGHSVARTWEEVTCVWRKVYMSEDAVEERFGDEIAKKLPYDQMPQDERKKDSQTGGEIRKQACVIELWDKEDGKVYWISKSYPEFLDERDDPLKLQDFFPCPRPLYASTTNETLVPLPDFTLYQDQANELDILADRIDGLTKMLQLKGVYDGSADASLARLFTEGENGTLLPVKNWAAFAEKGGLKGQVDVYDLTPIAAALEAAKETMEQIKNQVYELMGIADIVRGASDPNETLGAQELKGQYVSMRLNSMKQSVAEYATEILQLKAQVMCSKFNPKTLLAIGAADQLQPQDQQVIPQALALLIGQDRMMDPEADSPNPLRSFRIEVAADSLVQMNEQQEKADRVEFLQAQAQWIKEITGMAQNMGPAAGALGPLIMELWKWSVTAYKVGKGIEGAFDETADKLKQMSMQPQPQQPDPAIIKAQADTQIATMKQQHEAEAERARSEREQQAMAFEQQKAMWENQLENQRIQFEDQAKQREESFERWKTEFEGAIKVQVAEIGAKAQLDTAQMSADTAAGETIAKDLNGKAVKPMEEMIKSHKELIQTLAKGQEQKPKRKTGTVTNPTTGQQYKIDMTEQ
jgi:hypothetical protein